MRERDYPEYIEFTKGKKHPGKYAHISKNIDDFNDCGYLLKKNELVVDIDNLPKESIKKMIEIFDINTQIVWTDRGAHLYFKKPISFKSNKAVIPLGFEVEYKYYPKSEHITVRRGGVTREIENEGVREELPEFLTPKHKGGYVDMSGWCNGDGRNNGLFVHKKKIAHLSGNKLSYLEFINKYVFEEPLDDGEFYSVSRDANAIDPDKEENKEKETADLFKKNHKVVKFNGNLFFYWEGAYSSDPDELTRAIYMYCPEEKSKYVEEVIKQINYNCELIPKDKIFPIKVNNGIIDDGDFTPCEFTDFTPYAIDVDYDPNAKPVKAVDDYLNQLTDNDPEYINLIKEILGHGLITNKEVKRLLAKFFIFIGDGGNGKGTLLQVIKNIYGFENCSALSIKEMSNERYLNKIVGKLVNLGDDIHNEPINNDQMKKLKNISSCDFIETRELYKNSQTTEPTVSLIFTSNHRMSTFEKGESFKRRIIWLPMFTKPKKKDPRFITKLTTPEARKYWLRLAVEGYKSLYENGEFSKVPIVDKYNDEYHFDNDSTLEYIECLVDEQIENVKPKILYDDYKTWAEDNGLNVQGKKQFYQNIETLKGFISKPSRIDGKSVRVFRKKD